MCPPPINIHFCFYLSASCRRQWDGLGGPFHCDIESLLGKVLSSRARRAICLLVSETGAVSGAEGGISHLLGGAFSKPHF